MIDEQRLRAHHVGDGHDRKIEPVGLACLQIDGGRTGRAHAAAEDIGTDDKEPVGVERFARAHHGLPPAWAAGDGVRIGDVLVAGQSVTEENGVGFGRIESAIGLVGDGQRAKAAPESMRNGELELRRSVKLSGETDCVAAPFRSAPTSPNDKALPGKLFSLSNRSFVIEERPEDASSLVARDRPDAKLRGRLAVQIKANRRKQMKIKESKIAFVYYRLFSGIKTFQ